MSNFPFLRILFFFPAAAWKQLCPDYLHESLVSTLNLPDLDRICLMSCSQNGEERSGRPPTQPAQNTLRCSHSGPRVFGGNCELWD